MADKQISLIIPGTPTSGPLEPGLRPYLNIKTISAHNISAARGGDPAMETQVEAPPDSIARLQFTSGLVEYIRVDDFHDQLGTSRDPGPVRVPVYLNRGATQSRGGDDWTLEALHIFGVAPSDILAEETATSVVRHFDGRIDAGLYPLGAEGKGSQKRTQPLPSISQPYLIFIHGTASSTEGSFSGFWDTSQMDSNYPLWSKLVNSKTAEWDKLLEVYGDRIYALEHATFSVGPAQNALDLIALLPDNANLHVVTHSRGGLVGELLGIGSMDPADLRTFDDRPDKPQLLELVGQLKKKNLTISKFVRTACPAGGTILAGKRLDTWLNVLLNAIGRIPGFAGNPWFELVKATAIELIKLRADPAKIPGIEAQMPESPFIHLLNAQGRVSQSDLGVIAGIYDGVGVGLDSTLASWALQAFYLEDNDFVVNTRSMSAGMERPREVGQFLDKGSGVNHFSYFRNLRTRGKIVEWLTAPPFAQVNEFDRVRSADEPDASASRGGTPLPVAIVVPDVFGTLLASAGTQVWLNYRELAKGHLLQLKSEDLQPSGLHSIYQPLLKRLADNYRVLVFAYDWRKPITESAGALQEFVKGANLVDGNSVSFVAHGMGGLVVREYARSLGGDEWNRLTTDKGGLLMLGTPQEGSWNIARLLNGTAPLVQMLALLGAHTPGEVAALFRGFPGLIDLLPAEMLDPASWKGLNAERPDPQLLANSKNWREGLNKAAIPAGRMISVLGSAPDTPSALDDYSLDGDGDTLRALSLPEKFKTWYNSSSAHGDLISNPDPIVELLVAGTTASYDSRSHPQSGAIDPQRLRARDAAVYFPSERDLLDAAFVRRPAPAVSSQSVIRVRVTHGHLKEAAHPVIVGHYIGDSMVSAEAALDGQLDGRLSTRYYMDIYPGPVGTADVVRADACHPPGALVIGLGEVGEITADKVRRSVFEGCIRYALMRAEEPLKPGVKGPHLAGLSSLLIGVSGGRAINIAASVNAVVRGALEANRVLTHRNLIDKAIIDEIEFIDNYEAAAIEASHACERLSETLKNYFETGERVDFDHRMRSTTSGLTRPATATYSTGWWRRIRIAAPPNAIEPSTEPGVPATPASTQTLKFENLTDRARAEGSDVSIQLSAIDSLLDTAIKSSSWDRTSAVALFELLQPNPLKDQFSDTADLVLVVDSVAARYPWELMAERLRDKIEPLAVNMGVLRQLKVETFRVGPRGAREHNALVVGDTISDLPPLPGAQMEATAVSELLRRFRYDSKLLVCKSPAEIIRSLFATDYRILHLAGHGDYNAKNPARSGMVLSRRKGDSAHDVFLTPLELRQIRNLPELVFINCCHLGSIDQPLNFPAHRLAASVAEELIKMGVKAVIAAGWAVNDAAAANFAKVFYGAMLAGGKFGEAVKQARIDTYRLGNNNTWGAYQCYGDPDFALSLERGAYQYKPLQFCSRRECIDELRNVVASAQGASADEISDLRRRIQDVSRALTGDWRDGEALCAIAEAYKKINDFESAIDMYSAAIAHRNATAPITAIEQLANVRDRYALKLAKKEPSDLPAALKHWGLAETSLEVLNTLVGVSSERLSLLGALWKRRAPYGTLGKQESYKKASDFYTEAYRYERGRSGKIDLYAGSNAVALAYLSGATAGIEEEYFKEAESLKDTPDFWSRVYKPDALVYQYLINGDSQSQINEIIDQYRRIFDHATAEQRQSTLDQLRFLKDNLRDDCPQKDRDALDQIIKAFT